MILKKQWYYVVGLSEIEGLHFSMESSGGGGGGERRCQLSGVQAPGISLSALPNSTDDGYGWEEQTQKGHGLISGQLRSQDLHSGSPSPYQCISVPEDHSIWSLH